MRVDADGWLLCAQYYAEKVAESAQTLGPSGLGGQLMQLHASGDVLGKTETSLVIAGGGSDVASTLGPRGLPQMEGGRSTSSPPPTTISNIPTR